MKYGPGSDETDPEALRIAFEVFSAPPALREPGALPRPARPASPTETPQEEPLEEPRAEPVAEPQAEALSRTSPASSSKEKGSSRGPGAHHRASRALYKINPALIVQGQLQVAAVNRDDSFGRAVAQLFGVGELDALGSCCLPGHSGQGRVTRAKDGRFVYVCGCTSDDGYRALTGTYMSTISGRVAEPAKGKNAKREKLQKETGYFIWTRRLLFELGAVVPDYPALLPLPADADESTIKVYEGLGLLLGLRAGTDLPEEFLFSRPFVMDWCQLPEDAARAGIEALRNAHIIEMTGVTKVGGRKAYLYRVGGGA